MASDRFLYDAFISHAVEDKIAFAFELSQKLKESGLRIWYSGDDIDYGDPLSGSVHTAMAKSRFGIVIFSPTYLQKHWTMEEFYHFWNRDGKNKEPVVVLPVYYNTTAEEVSRRVLLLGDRFSVSADKGIEVVVEKIRVHIRKEKLRVQAVRRRNLAIVSFLIALLCLSGFYGWKITENIKPAAEVVETLLSKRIEKVQPTLIGTSQFISLVPVKTSYIDSIYQAYVAAKSYYRNDYEFNNGFGEVRARKNVNEVLGLSAQELTPSNLYGMDSARILQSKNSGREVIYRYTNLAPVVKTIEPISTNEELIVFRVHYKNNIRMVEVSLQFPSTRTDTKRHRMAITGLKPIETYQVFQSGGTWQIREIDATRSETN